MLLFLQLIRIESLVYLLPTHPVFRIYVSILFSGVSQNMPCLFPEIEYLV